MISPITVIPKIYENFSVGGDYYAYPNLQNFGSLVEGVDYKYTLTYTPGPSKTFTGTTYEWDFGTNKNGTYTYIDTLWGHNWGSAGTFDKATQVKNIASFTESFTSVYTGSGDVMTEIFTFEAVNTTTKTVLGNVNYNGSNDMKVTGEYMVYVHAPWVDYWQQSNPYPYQGTYTINGVVADIYAGMDTSAPGGARQMVQFVLRSDLLSGSIDWGNIITYVSSHNLINLNDYVIGIEFGSETNYGTGKLALTQFNVNQLLKTNSQTGSNGNDLIAPKAALSGIIDGGLGTDTVSYDQAASTYKIACNIDGTVKVTTNDQLDTLKSVERLQFLDKTVAIDMGLTQSGGKTALLMGAVLGKSSLTDRAMVGNLLKIFDTGISLHDAADLLVKSGAIDGFAGGTGTDKFVNLIYHAVTGQTATTDITSGFASLIGGAYSKTNFLTAVAEHQINQNNVGLVGLQQTGIEYL